MAQSHFIRNTLKQLAWIGFFLLSNPGYAEGRLDAFESGFSASPSERKSRSEWSNDSGGTDRNYFWDDLIFGFLHAGGGSSALVAKNRLNGHPVVPIVRSDVGWMWVDSHVQAVDVGVEIGYAMFAVEGRWTEFLEEDPGASLGYGHLHVLYRMAVEDLEVGLGIGPSWLKGDNTHNSVSMTTPIRYWPEERWGIEIRPVWTDFNGVGLRDIDTSLLYRRGTWTAALGYRWIESEADVEGLSGIRAAVGFRY